MQPTSCQGLRPGSGQGFLCKAVLVLSPPCTAHALISLSSFSMPDTRWGEGRQYHLSSVSGSCKAAIAWLGTWAHSGAVSLNGRRLGCCIRAPSTPASIPPQTHIFSELLWDAGITGPLAQPSAPKVLTVHSFPGQGPKSDFSLALSSHSNTRISTHWAPEPMGGVKSFPEKKQRVPDSRNLGSSEERVKFPDGLLKR